MGTLLRALIVDDEPVARQVLREEVETIDDVEVIGEADNGATALRAIEEDMPDLVFLDLQMPEMTGLEVIRRLKGGPSLPAVVILTAWDQYAIQAFEAGAIDYLLKPVSRERLLESVERARRITAREAANRVAKIQEFAEPRGAKPARRIVARVGSDYLLLNADEVFAFQAEGDLVWIMTAKNKYLATQTLKALEDRLADTGFRRIHRGALVNIDHARRMSTLSSQRWLLTLSNKMEFIVSKRQAGSIRRLLNW